MSPIWKIRNPKAEIRNADSSPVAISRNSDFDFRLSNFLRISIFGFRVLCLILCCCFASSILAAEPNGASDLPPSSLKPPRGELVPTFWEQHGALLVVAAILFLVLCAVGIWFLFRPKPQAPTPPAIVARQELEVLRQKPEDGALLSRSSQILHRYLSATFGLPAEELTTSEFCRVLEPNEAVGRNLAGDICDFLRAADVRKFAPVPAQPPLGAVQRCLSIVEQAEIRAIEVRRAAETASNINERPTGPAERRPGLA